MKIPILGMTEVTIPSVRGFILSVTNDLIPKYYIANDDATVDAKVPYQIYEGRRKYNLSLQVDLIDSGSFDKDTPWLELLNQGMDTTFKGSSMDLTFTRGTNDTPAAGAESQGALVVSAPFSINTEGVVGVTMSMLMRDLKIVVVDSIAGASYPV